MAIDFSDCSKLPRRLRKICEKDESIDPEVIEIYHAGWENRVQRLMRPAPAATGHNRDSQPACQTRGPGTQMKRLLQELNVPHAWCESCSQRAATMDANGIDWCRQNRETITGWLREAEAKFARDAARVERGDGQEPTPKQIAEAKTAQRWKTGWAAAKQLIWINPASPFDSLVSEAIRRAEAAS